MWIIKRQAEEERLRNFTVFIGRWSEKEMQRRGFEPDAPKRAVAARSEADAIKALNCPKAWFDLHFLKAGKRDVEVSSLCKQHPGEVFELHYEEVFRNSRIERIHHWVRLSEVTALLEGIRDRRQKRGQGLGKNCNESWRDRIKEASKVIMLKKCA